MSKNKNKIGVVYSTNPNYQYEYIQNKEEPETLEPSKQKLYISLDKKNRSGKQVTIIENFIGKKEDLKQLEKIIKTKCFTGGTIKENTIIIQGDFREKAELLLKKLGYKIIKKN